MTKIEWADETWNPITGCTPISEGCQNCYAQRMARRLAGRYGYPDAPNHFDVTIHDDKLWKPNKIKRARRIFVCSMGDLYHDDCRKDSCVKWAEVFKIWAVMYQADWHTYQLLTKRPQNALEFYNTFLKNIPQEKFSHIWLGVTAENQKRYDERWTIASQIPAAVKFVSIEPALEYVNIDIFAPWPDWVIWGPETGPGKRPFKPEWAEETYELCQLKGIPFFDKRKDYLARESPGNG